MAARDEAGALAGSGCVADQERLGAALVAALELALMTAHRLLSELDSAAGRHSEAAAHLERARSLLALAGPTAAVSEPAEVHGRLVQRCARPVRRDPHPAPDRPACTEASITTSASAPQACHAGLTRRELEVLRLIAAGKSNREIAKTLYLSPRTAERHVANIYLKLGTHSKAEAAAYALRHNLA